MRLILRPFDQTDTRAYAQMFADRRVWTLIPPAYWRVGPQSRIRTWRRLTRIGQVYHFIIRTRDKNEFVGEIALHHLEWDYRRAEVGYHIVRSQWGKGFATESASRLCQWAFQTLRLHRLEAVTEEENHASKVVLRKLGFRLEGRRPERARWGRRWRTALEYGLLKANHRKRRRNYLARSIRSTHPV